MFIVRKKKDIFRELAVSLFLMKNLVFHPKAPEFMARLMAHASEALAAALPYTGVLDIRHAREFLEVTPKKFTIACGSDIVTGDTLRFIETISDNRFKPPSLIGKRGVTAKVVAVGSNADNPMLLLQVIACGGVWDIEPGTEIRRSMKSIIRYDIRRSPWPDEAERGALKSRNQNRPRQATFAKKPDTHAATASTSATGRYNALREPTEC